jgi:hypothetical protein
MYNVTQTSEKYGNTGDQPFPGNVGKWFKWLLVPKGTEIATEALALLKDTWVDSLNAAPGDRFFLTPKIFNGTPTQEANVKETSDFGYESEVRKGKLNYKISFDEMSTYSKNQINKLDGKDFDVYVVTEKDYLLGYTVDNIKFLPLQLDYFSILPETQIDGKANAHVECEVRFSDTRQLNEFAVALNPSVDAIIPWYPTIDLKGITDLFLEVVSMTATGAVINLKNYGKVPYSAAVKEDLYMRKTTVDGVAIALTTMTPSATVDGQYTLVFPTQTSGTFYFSLYGQPVATTQWVETRLNTSFTFNAGS